MPIRWNDSTERMMLIKFLEQNMSAKFNPDVARETWPAGLEPPTARTLYDHFRNTKQKLTKQNEEYTSAGTNPDNTQAIPPTPSRKRAATTNGAASKKQKTTANGASSIKSTFRTTKVNGTASKTSKSPGRSKRNNDESEDEASMSEHNSESEAEADNDNNEETPEAEDPVTIKRKLPSRTSKSVAPGLYAVDQDDESGTEAGDNDDDDDEGHIVAVNGNVNGNGDRGKAKAVKMKAVDDGDDDDGDDESFNPNAYRMAGDGGARKSSLGWRERINLIDGLNGNMQV